MDCGREGFGRGDCGRGERESGRIGVRGCGFASCVREGIGSENEACGRKMQRSRSCFERYSAPNSIVSTLLSDDLGAVYDEIKCP